MSLHYNTRTQPCQICIKHLLQHIFILKDTQKPESFIGKGEENKKGILQVYKNKVKVYLPFGEEKDFEKFLSFNGVVVFTMFWLFFGVLTKSWLIFLMPGRPMLSPLRM